MKRIRASTLGLALAFVLLLGLLLVLRGTLFAAHLDRSIEYVASDAATYFSLYQDFYEDLDLAENPALFLIGSPILFMKLAGGDLFVIQALNLVVMAASLKAALSCLPDRRARFAFMAGALAFPYFLFGFLSLNKEVYAMCSAILYTAYMAKGRRSHLLAALVLAACARYYMLVALVTLLVLVPRDRTPRYGWMFVLLIAISFAAPLVKSLVPGYSGEDLLEDSGSAGLFFSRLIDSFGYALAYPVKYVVLIPMRAYGLLIGSGRSTVLLAYVVSILSFAALVVALGTFSHRRRSALVQRLVVAGLVAPMPLMWSEIMHWRYYSFVYFFFLFAIVVDREERRSLGTPRAAVRHA
jgi:hypothetical protein